MQPDTIARKKAQGLPFAVLCVIVIILCMAFSQPVSAATSSKAVTITADYIGIPPVVDFTNSSDTLREGVGRLRVQFIDKTTGPHDNWEWDFGDKTVTSLENYVQNPVHTYEIPGKYYVSLKVNSAAGSVTELKPNYITVNSQIKLTSQTDLPASVETSQYSLITIKASGGAPPYVFSASEGLPPGLKLDTSTGAIYGTPTKTGIFSFIITATDKNGLGVSGSQKYTIEVKGGSSGTDNGDSGPGGAAPSDGISGNVGTQAIDSHGIDLSVNGVSIATGAAVTVNGNLVTITTPTFTVVYVSGKITEEKGMLISQDAGSISLSTESVEASIPGVGDVSGSVEAGIDSISDGAEVNLTLAKPRVKDIVAFTEAMKKEGKEIEAVAFTMTVTKSNITANLPAKITMTVPPDWVARNGGLSAVSIMRTADDGTTQVLPTTFTGIDYATGNLVFEGFSKDGLSVFGLVTAKASAVEQAEQPNTTVVAVSKPAMSTNVGMYAWLMGIVEQNPVIIVIVLVVVALIAYLGWWRRRL